MGWWSATIMGGDTPLDCQGDIFEDICGLEHEYDRSYPREYVKNALTINLKEIKKQIIDTDRYEEIGGQVVGAILMRLGVDPTHPDAEELLLHARDCALRDQWATSSEERCDYINKFIEALDRYDGTPLDIDEEGLFEAMSNKMYSNKTSQPFTRVPVSAVWLANHPDVTGYIYSHENDEMNLDPWTVITGVDQASDGESVILEYGQFSERVVEPDFTVFVDI